MAQFKNVYKVELNQGTAPVFSLRQIYYGDVEANRIGAIVLLNGEPVALSGTCSGTAILADGSTVVITGTVDGSQAYVELPAACYSVEGQIEVYVKLTVDGVTTTLIAGVGTVRLTETDTVIDPGTIIPSVAALIEDIDEAVASIPADYSALLASIAPAYSDLTFPVSAGTFCWYSGALYAANQDIPTSEAWTAAHWDSATIGGAIGKISSGLSGRIDTLHNLVDYGYSTESSISYTAGDNNLTASRSGTKVVINGTLAYNATSIVCIRLNGELVLNSSHSNFKNTGGGIALKDGHKYRWMMKIVSGAINTDGWFAGVYKQGRETPILEPYRGATLADGTKVYDFQYTTADYPDGVKLAIAIRRKNESPSVNNAVFECFLCDITHNAQIITDSNINYALRATSNLSGSAAAGGYINLDKDLGTTIPTSLKVDADYGFDDVPCHAGDKFYLTCTVSGDEPRAWAFLDENRKLLRVAAAGDSPSDLELTAYQDGYFICNHAVASAYNLTARQLYKAMPIPTVPDSDGTYVLTCTVSGGVPTYSWTAQS